MKNLNLRIIFLLCVSSLIASCQKHSLTDDAPKPIETSEMTPDEHGVYTLSNGMRVTKEDDYYVYQGDMLLSENQVKEINQGGMSRGVYTSNWNKQWGNGTNVYYIPYVIENSILQQPKSSTAILKALTHISDRTNVYFRPKNNSDRDYIAFRYKENRNSSSLGKVGGKQFINLHDYDLMHVVVHEICHALGLFHEQSRKDRDNYITVHYNNIIIGQRHNFDIENNSTSYGPFDFSSIMLYDSHAFSKADDLYTITKKDGSPFETYNYVLSDLDIAAINRFYPEPKHVMTGKKNVTPGETETYSISRVPSDATVTWRLSDPSAGTFVSGQGTDNVQIKFTKPTQSAIAAEIKHRAGYVRSVPAISYVASYEPMVEEIEVSKYQQGPGEHTLFAKILNYPNSTIEWFSSGDAVFYEHPYSFDALFATTPNLYTAVDFYSSGDYLISLTASHPGTHGAQYSQYVTPIDVKSHFPFNLSPNPMNVGEVVEVNIDNAGMSRSLASGACEVSVFDKDKVLVYQTIKNGNNFDLDLSSLGAGTYSIKAKENGKTYSTKITINK